MEMVDSRWIPLVPSSSCCRVHSHYKISKDKLKGETTMGVEIWALIMLAVIVVAIVMGLHVFLALSAIPLIFGLIFVGDRVLNLFPVNAFGMFINYAFVAVPFFVYMGTLMEHAGVVGKLFEAFYQLLGPVRAGLSLATI